MNKYITEFIGTLFLVMGAAMYGAVGATLALMVMVYAGGHISGAHYNPAVTVAVWMRGRIEMKDAIMYWIFQLAGAVAAALIVSYVFDKQGPGTCDIIPEGGTMKAIAAELIGTFALAYVVLNVATAKGNSNNSFYGIAIAATVLAMAYTVGGFSGGSFNPAVAVGLVIQKTFCINDLVVYIFSALGGAVIAALVFSLNNPDDK